MRTLVVAALVLAAAALVALPSAATAKPDLPACQVTSFNPETGEGTMVCGPYFCYVGPSHGGLRCFG